MMNKYLIASLLIMVPAIIAVLMAYPSLQAQTSQIDGSAKPIQNISQTVSSAISGENVYIVWTTDKNMPNNKSEVFFRASTDSGATFGDKTNLSNTVDSDSFNAEIAATDGDEVIVTWWERNQTSEEPVLRASVDNGLTFGPLMYLSTNGTLAQEEIEEAIND
jgi:hypothetical protein